MKKAIHKKHALGSRVGLSIPFNTSVNSEFMESLLWKPGHSVSLANLNTDCLVDLATF